MVENNILLLFFAVLGGALPPLIWLFFWLREDAHPEPKPLIVAVFLAGVLTVPIAIFLENLFTSSVLFALADRSQTAFKDFPAFFQSSQSLSLLANLLPPVIIEEGLKLGAFLVLISMNKNFDEPVDALIYLITIALGFAAFENILFFLNNVGIKDFLTVHNVFLTNEVPRAFIVNNLRFIGANLLHLVASGFIGVAIGLAFYKKTSLRILYTVGGFCAAIFLHLAFNYFIIVFAESPVMVFAALWVFAIVLLLMFEEVKRVHKEKFQSFYLSLEK